MVGTLRFATLRITVAASSQRLVVIPRTIALRRGDVAVLVIVVLDPKPRQPFRFIVGFLRRFAVLAGSAHIIPLRHQSVFALRGDSE
jgi:hypothetical protein